MTETTLLPALTKESVGATVWLRLQRPAAMNAISPGMLTELNLALDEIESDESVRVVVLTGTGRAFCAGADLKSIANAAGEVDPGQVIEFVAYAGRTIERLAALDQPVIAGVNGLALAGGLELLLASDIVVASSAARIGDAHANYGLTPGAGGSVRLARVVAHTWRNTLPSPAVTFRRRRRCSRGWSARSSSRTSSRPG